MKILKRIGLGLLAVIVLLLLISFFLPSKVHVERSLTMKAPPEVVFQQVNTLKNMEKWSPWHKLDPNMQLTYSGPAEGVGAKYAWKSDKRDVGSGSYTITESKPDSVIRTEMNFGDMGISHGSYHFAKTADGGTNVTWGMESDMGHNPIAKYFGLFMDKMVGPDFDKGLQSMNEEAMKASVAAAAPAATAPAAEKYKVEEVNVPVMTVLSISDKASMQDIPAKLGAAYGEMMKYIAKNKLKATGPPMAFYKDFYAKPMEIEAVMPVDKMAKKEGRIVAKMLPATKAIMVKYYGPYMKMMPAYDAIQSYMKEKKMTQAGTSWEKYVTDPKTVNGDSSKILTEIYYPVK